MASPTQRWWGGKYQVEKGEKTRRKQKEERRKQKCCRFVIDFFKKTEHVTTGSDSGITWSKDCILLSENKLQFIHLEKSSGLYQTNHISHMLILSGWKFSKLPESEKLPFFFLIQPNYFKPQVTQLCKRGQNKDQKCFLHSNRSFPWLCTHGNPPIATGRACLQEWVCVYLRWDTQGLHAAKNQCF